MLGVNGDLRVSYTGEGAIGIALQIKMFAGEDSEIIAIGPEE